MPHIKSKGQTRPRGTSVTKKSTRKVNTGQMKRTQQRENLRELPTRKTRQSVPAHVRRQGESDYAGASARAFAVARSKRQASEKPEARPQRSAAMATSYGSQKKARAAGRRPRKVAASSGKPRSKIGRAPVRRR